VRPIIIAAILQNANHCFGAISALSVDDLQASRISARSLKFNMSILSIFLPFQVKM
jgi:hypothetical protein